MIKYGLLLYIFFSISISANEVYFSNRDVSLIDFINQKKEIFIKNTEQTGNEYTSAIYYSKSSRRYAFVIETSDLPHLSYSDINKRPEGFIYTGETIHTHGKPIRPNKKILKRIKKFIDAHANNKRDYEKMLRIYYTPLTRIKRLRHDRDMFSAKDFNQNGWLIKSNGELIRHYEGILTSETASMENLRKTYKLK
jgi:hypothetical protein